MAETSARSEAEGPLAQAARSSSSKLVIGNRITDAMPIDLTGFYGSRARLASLMLRLLPCGTIRTHVHA